MLSSFCEVRVALYILVLFGLLMKSHAELNTGRTFSLTILCYFLSKLVCPWRLLCLSLQDSQISEIFALTALLFLLFFVTCYCTYCGFVANHGLLFLNLLHGEPLPLIFSVLSCHNIHFYLIKCMRGKSLYGGKDLDIFWTVEDLVLSEIGGGIIALTSRPWN